MFRATPGTVASFDRQLRVAGQDGRLSKAFVIVDPKGIRTSATQLHSEVSCRRDVRNLLDEIFSRRNSDSIIGLEMYGLTLKLDISRRDIEEALTILRDELGIIEFGVYEFNNCRYKYSSAQNFSFAKSSSLVDNTIASHSTQSGRTYNLHLRSATLRAAGLDYSQVINRLRNLEECGHISFHLSDAVLPTRILQFPSLRSGTDNIKAIEERVYSDLQRQWAQRKQNQQQLVELFTQNRCATVGLAERLGAELPGGRTRCERCEWCLTGKPLVLLNPDEANHEIEPKLVKAILEAVPDRENPRLLARVATGVYSSLVRRRKLNKLPVFRSMQNVNFDVSAFSLFPFHAFSVAYVTWAADIGSLG